MTHNCLWLIITSHVLISSLDPSVDQHRIPRCHRVNQMGAVVAWLTPEPGPTEQQDPREQGAEMLGARWVVEPQLLSPAPHGCPVLLASLFSPSRCCICTCPQHVHLRTNVQRLLTLVFKVAKNKQVTLEEQPKHYGPLMLKESVKGDLK